LELRDEVRGLLSNPNCEYQLNHVALRTLAAFVNCQETWDERAEYLRALKEWLVFFGSVGTPISFEDLVRLGDCYYLPHNEGPQAEALLGRMARVLASELNAREGEVARLREDFGRWRAFFGQLSEIRNRPLFNALFRRLWDLREELDLAERYIEFKSRPENRNSFFRSDFHQLGTYRGGVVARLQRELMQESDGSFHPMRHPKQQETAPALSA
jgi:protein O-GlcNAcase/histone acetyltransferase